MECFLCVLALEEEEHGEATAEQEENKEEEEEENNYHDDDDEYDDQSQEMYGFEINLKEGKGIKTFTIFPAEFHPTLFAAKKLLEGVELFY